MPIDSEMKSVFKTKQFRLRWGPAEDSSFLSFFLLSSEAFANWEVCKIWALVAVNKLFMVCLKRPYTLRVCTVLKKNFLFKVSLGETLLKEMICANQRLVTITTHQL